MDITKNKTAKKTKTIIIPLSVHRDIKTISAETNQPIYKVVSEMLKVYKVVNIFNFPKE
jgi:hypothetical protein